MKEKRNKGKRRSLRDIWSAVSSGLCASEAISRNRLQGWSAARRAQLRRARQIVYHLMGAAIVIGVLLLGLLRVPEACLRFWESMRDLGNSLFIAPPTVTLLPRGMAEGFPRKLEEIGGILQAFGKEFISKENLIAYGYRLAEFLRVVAYGLLYIVMPVVLFLSVFCIASLNRRNRNYGCKSLPLRIHLTVRTWVYLPVRRFLGGFVRFFRRSKYRVVAIVYGLFFLEVYTVALGFLAYYFHFLFAVSDTLLGYGTVDTLPLLGTAVVKLVYDVWLAFRSLPLAAWIVIAVYLFDKFRKEIGYTLLEAHEERLRDFLRDRGVNILICGQPRTGKTTLLISVVKSLQAMAREDAHSGMRELNRKFPDFPWIVFERMLRREHARHRVYTLVTARVWTQGMIDVALKTEGKREEAAFLRHLNKEYGACSGIRFEHPFFNYDRKRFPVFYDGGLGKESIESALLNYAQLYLIFIQPMLAISNLSIRFDNDWVDHGNFPRWRDDFFRHEPDGQERSLYSHIFNQDLFRPGKQVDPGCGYADSYEFGIAAMTELGKERGNQFDRAGMKKDAENANLLNDMYNSFLKMMGHLGTVYFRRFAFFCGDEQRAESVGADAREIFDVVTIAKADEEKIVMPFFALEEALYLLTKKLFGDYYERMRVNRGDKTLIMYLLEHFCKKIYDHYDRIRNRFGGHSVRVLVERAMIVDKKLTGSNGGPDKGKLFVSNVKCYANVFRTDGHRGVMEDRVRRSEMGIGDIPCYSGLELSLDDIAEMRSYFFKDLLEVYGGREPPPEAVQVILAAAKELHAAATAALGAAEADGLLAAFTKELPSLVKADEPVQELAKRLTKSAEELLKTAVKERDKRKGERSSELKKRAEKELREQLGLKESPPKEKPRNGKQKPEGAEKDAAAEK